MSINNNIYDDMDEYFNSLIDKYNNNDILIDELIQLKKNLIILYESKYDNFQNHIIKNIKKKSFQMNDKGEINMV